ncbi:uncharacterized protein LOC144360032 [Saccoglossus kowalevskii]
MVLNCLTVNVMWKMASFSTGVNKLRTLEQKVWSAVRHNRLSCAAIHWAWLVIAVELLNIYEMTSMVSSLLRPLSNYGEFREDVGILATTFSSEIVIKVTVYLQHVHQ